MKERIFEYSSYKTYLRDWIRTSPNHGRGMKSSLAEAAQCQTTYVSQVLGGDRHFSLEQAELINLFLSHDADESRFFILLVTHERAGHAALRARFKQELAFEREKYLNLKDRLKGKKDELSPEIQAQYYRNWYHTAIHVCLTVAKLRTKEAIARALSLPVKQVGEALDFLTSVGLAEKRGHEYRTGNKVIFIGRDNPLLSQHHVNWRHQAIRSIDLNEKDDVHYSGVVSVTAQDAETIRSIFLKSIEAAHDVWKISENEEELRAICVDFFKVSRS